MTADVEQVLQSGSNPQELSKAATSVARSAVPADGERLRALLSTEAFLRRLDSDADYTNAAKFRLRVSRVVEALARNPAPGARKAFLELLHDKTFLAEDERTLALVQAGAHARPAPPELVKFWDAHSRPDDGFTPTTIAALVDNGSPPAVALLEKKLADPTHSEDEKRAWMRTLVLTHRNDLTLLEGCERMLEGSLPAPLRPALVEALFDYRPGEWYRPATVVSPPDLAAASQPALAKLRKLGKIALARVPLGEVEKRAVEGRLAASDRLIH
jgi:hypothetical protein